MTSSDSSRKTITETEVFYLVPGAKFVATAGLVSGAAGTVTLQYLNASGDWVDFSSSDGTLPFSAVVSVPQTGMVRWEVVGGTSPAVAVDFVQQTGFEVLYADGAGVTAESVQAAISEDPEAARAASGSEVRRKYLHGPNHAMRAFRTKLDRGQSGALLFLSDSTGSPLDAWIRLFANDLVARYPNHRVEYRQCNSAGTTTPLPLTVLQPGTERQHWHVPAGVSLYVPFLPYTAWRTGLTSRYVGIEVEVAPTSAAALNGSGYPTAGVELGGCKGTGNGVWMSISQFGQITLNYYDGTGLITQNNQGGTSIPAMVVGTYVRYRVLLDTQNGGTRLAQFAYSTDQGLTWTPVGINQTPAQTASPNIVASDSTTATSLGRVNGTDAADGYKYSHMQIFTGSTYEPVLPARVDAYHLVSGATSSTALLQGSPVIQIDNIAVDGAGIGTGDWFTITLPTRAKDYLIDKCYDSVVISSSHNDAALSGTAWGLRMDALRSLVAGRCPVAPSFLHICQNPESEDYAAEGIRTQHNLRQADIIAYAARKGSPVFDAYQAFLDDGRPIRGTLVREFTTAPSKDGVHPTTAGYRLWADKFFDSVFLDGTNETL